MSPLPIHIWHQIVRGIDPETLNALDKEHVWKEHLERLSRCGYCVWLLPEGGLEANLLGRRCKTCGDPQCCQCIHECGHCDPCHRKCECLNCRHNDCEDERICSHCNKRGGCYDCHRCGACRDCMVQCSECYDPRLLCRHCYTDQCDICGHTVCNSHLVDMIDEEQCCGGCEAGRTLVCRQCDGRAEESKIEYCEGCRRYVCYHCFGSQKVCIECHENASESEQSD